MSCLNIYILMQHASKFCCKRHAFIHFSMEKKLCLSAHRNTSIVNAIIALGECAKGILP